MKRLLLVGAGHSHLEVVKSFRQGIPQGWQVLLLSASGQGFYSGMVPGYIAGDYRLDDLTIDIAALCERCGVLFECAMVKSIDPAAQTVLAQVAEGGRLLDGQKALLHFDYDVLSINTGSQSLPVGDLAHTGSGRYQGLVPVKPVEGLLRAWSSLLANTGAGSRRIVIVGNGAAGVELAFAMQHFFSGRSPASSSVPTRTAEVILLGKQAEALQGFNRVTRNRVAALLRKSGIVCRGGFEVAAIERGRLIAVSGDEQAFDKCFWAAGAHSAVAADNFPFRCDVEGFIEVEPSLQVAGFGNVFAAGDAVSLLGQPCPKAGVYAVRQGRVLASNLKHSMRAEPLETYRPQSAYLALLNLGNRYALANRGGFSVAGKWVWRWKNFIDKRYIAGFR